MKRVLKYPLPLKDRFALTMPLGARLLNVADQEGWPMLWALVDDEQATEPREFALIGTGNIILEEDMPKLGYIGTAVGPALVWHLFEVHS